MGLFEKKKPLPSDEFAEPAPPAYLENQPPSYAYSESATTQQLQSSSQSPNLRFPPQFNVYCHFSTFTLGPHKDDTPFTIIMTGLLKPMALVQGDDKKAPPLSTIRSKGLGGTSKLTILPHAGSDLLEPLEITIENHSTRHNFSIALPNQPPQYFEWRSSKSDEVKALGAYKSGWKLMWLRKDGQPDEIVAASSLNNTLSMNKGLKFGFFNAGLDGTLGDTFHIAAVTTAMHDFETFLSTRVAIAGNASSSSSSAAVAASS